MANRRVPEYFTGRPRAEGVRLATNAPFIRRQGIADNAIRAVTEVAAVYAAKAERERRIEDNRQFEESSIALNKTLSEKAVKYELNQEKFDQFCQKEREKFLANVSEDKRADYGLMFDRQAAGHSQRIFQNQQRVFKERQTATFLTASQNYYNAATTAARSGDMAEAQLQTENFMRVRESLLASGEISAEKYTDMGLRFSDELEKQKVLGEFDGVKTLGSEKVQEYIGSFMNREDMPIERRQRLANSLLAEYRTFQANNALVGKEYIEQANFIAEAVGKGLEPSVDTTAVLAGLENSGNYDTAKKLRQVIQLGKETKEFVKLDPAAMKAEIEELRKNQSTPYDLARLTSFEKTMDSAVKEIQSDPMNFAISRGIVEDAPLDFGRLDADKAKKRIANARLIQQRYSLPEAPVLTGAEASALAQAVNAGDARSNAALLSTINANFPEQTGTIVKSIAPKAPQFAQAAAIFSSNPNAAIEIIEGVDIMKFEPEYTPSSDVDFNDIYYKNINPAMFADMSPAWNENLKKTVKASLAAKNKQNGNTKRLAENGPIEDAIQSVVGDIVKIEMDGSGFFWDSSFNVPAPQGVSGKDFENWYQGLTDEDIPSAVTLSGLNLSVSDIHAYGTLHFAGNGQYRVRVNGELVYSKDGKPLVLHYKAED